MSEKYPGSVYRLTGTSGRIIVYEDKVDIERIGFLNNWVRDFPGTKTILMNWLKYMLSTCDAIRK